MTDFELLQQYVKGSQDAFTALVRRHIDLVYSTAMRKLRDASLAEDVTQRVFLSLSRKAGRLRRSTIVPAWLYNVTRCACLDAIRQRVRRTYHEHKAAQMTKRRPDTPMAVEDRHSIWAAVEPVFDPAMSELSRGDRQLLVMRFWEGRGDEEMGGALGISSEAVRKRVSRAVERLRAALFSHGVSVPLGSLSPVTLACAVKPAPPDLAIKTVKAVLSTRGAAATSGGIAKGAVAIMALSKTKVVVALAVGVLTLGGGGDVVRRVTGPKPVVLSLPASSAGSTIPGSPQFAGAWRARFNAVYGLSPSEILKHIAPPYVPERRTVWQTDVKDMARMMPESSKLSMVFSYDGSPHWQSASVGEPSIGNALESAVGLRPYEVESAVDLWKVPLTGDIVVREGALREQKLAAIEPLVGGVLGHPVHFDRRHVVRNVIVVSGQYRPIPAKKSDRVGSYEAVNIAVEGAEDEKGGVTSTNFEGFCYALESMLKMRVVDHRVAKAAAMVTYRRGKVGPAVAADPTVLDSLLRNLSHHTSLQFSVERQAMDVWQMKTVSASSAAQ